METFNEKVTRLFQKHEALITRTNEPIEEGNGIFTRYKYPVVTAAHTPVFWRYDLNEQTNPYLMERIGMNAALNSGAIKWNGKYLMVLRMEGADRKSFFAVAESPNGVDNFRFWDYPVTMPEDVIPATNIYDMRLTAHEDGWIYGIFCAERHDDNAPVGDLSSATATACVALLEGRDWLWLTERSAYSLGRSWYSVPPKATLISCSPQQMPSTGISRRRARSSNAKSYASRTVSTCPSAAEGSASKRAGSTSPPPISTKPSSRSNKRLRQAVSLISGMTTGIPPAASTAST